MKNKILIISIFLLLIPYFISAQINSLKQEIEKVISQKNATIGAVIFGKNTTDSLSINGNSHFPMQSVFKFHIALAVLNAVDKGHLNLNQDVYIKKSDLHSNTWSPIYRKYPNGGINLKLSEILKYTVSESDNNGCDILLNLAGGAKTVNNYIHKIGINDIAIHANEADMHKDWETQFMNWTTPIAATQLLEKFYSGQILSEESTLFLKRIMIETSTGKKLIKGQLPTETLVAHRSGLSETNEDGVTAAINDIGIVFLPNGNHFIISVFVSNSNENSETNEKIISEISKLAWNYFLKTD